MNNLKTFIVKHLNGNKIRTVSKIEDIKDRNNFTKNILLDKTKAFHYILCDFNKKHVDSDKEYEDFIEFCQSKDYIYLKCCIEKGAIYGDMFFLALSAIISITNIFLSYYKIIISTWITIIPIALALIGGVATIYPFQIKLFI